MTAMSRRDRLRAATLSEIIEVARRLLITDGQQGITLRAISREMGMTAPALYRYYDSLDKLVERLCVRLFDECIEHIRTETAGVPGPDARLVLACREFRRWSLAHRAEFTLMFASPADAMAKLPPQHRAGSEVYLAGIRFSAVFLTPYTEMWSERPFPVPADDDLPAELVAQLDAFKGTIGTALPVGALQVFLSHWIRLYGMVALEVYGHLRFALSNAEAMFETELTTVMLSLTRPFR